MAVKSMILKDLRWFTCSNLNILDPMTYDSYEVFGAKSVILMDLKSFRIILLQVMLRRGENSAGKGDFSHFGNNTRNGPSRTGN